MKFRVFVILVLVLASVEVGVTLRNLHETFAFTNGVLRLINQCKAGDVYSLPIPLPALNPLKIPPLTAMDSDFNLFLGETTVDGLQNKWFKRLSANLSRYWMSVEFVVPKMSIYSDQYRLEATEDIGFASFNVVFVGNNFTCYISNLNVRAFVQFSRRSGSNTVVNRLIMQYTGDVQAHFSGSPSYVNRRANAKISRMIRDPTAIRNVEELIKQRANRLLRGRTPQEFIQIISNI